MKLKENNPKTEDMTKLGLEMLTSSYKVIN